MRLFEPYDTGFAGIHPLWLIHPFVCFINILCNNFSDCSVLCIIVYYVWCKVSSMVLLCPTDNVVRITCICLRGSLAF